ncbi:MAG: HNH endonuclease [Ruminococcus sp.]|nr:HNH endonuclease [Ruminococcus sp.]
MKTTTEYKTVSERTDENINNVSHSAEALLWIKEQMYELGIVDFRFCKENDCYICDVNGNFFSVCKRQISKSGNFIEKYNIKKLAGSVDRYGYRTYRVNVNGVKKHLKAHRMMLNAWTGENPNLVVNHKDGNKLNNSITNLEWCTVAENNAHAIETGLLDPHAKKNFNYSIPLADWMIIYILYKHCGYSLSELGRMNGCVHDTIKRIIRKIDKIMMEDTENGK